MEKSKSNPTSKRPQEHCAEIEKIAQPFTKSAELQLESDISEDKSSTTEASRIKNAILDYNDILFGNFKY
ncbi:hypothetical protein [Dyadobacter sp. CY343]|uniref:hypothetical protein n=1 Tax=Dyadobacter sp. CY343 TaxID=2907299 RepID=UPI001F395413|nr:hypothetical protein [Dyadobacter sp. CY343]MCE7060217.1 hypothetical protein [Dyadobacter sp. CY343]